MADSSFWDGFLMGILVAGFVGFTMQQIRLARKRMKASVEPQKVSSATDKTPMQVIIGSLQAGCSVVFWLVVLVVGLWLVFEILS